MTEQTYSEPPIEHTNVKFPPPICSSVASDELLNEPPESLRSAESALELTARAFFQGAIAQSKWLKQYVELVQLADGDRATWYALGQIAQLGGQCMYAYDVKSANDMQTIERTAQLQRENSQPRVTMADIVAHYDQLFAQYMPQHVTEPATIESTAAR